MTQSIAVLGRQPALGLAELESLLGQDSVSPAGVNAALLNTDPEKVPFARLGGSIKLGKLLHEFKTTDWSNVQEYLEKILPDHLKYVPKGEKLQLGLSTYGVDISVKKQMATALALKKVAKSHKQSIRIVPNKTHELSSAQILHNKLFTPSGWELFFVQDDKRILLGTTTNIQDIEAYTARDQKRPKRDAKIGMLPPKLAQIIINLAGKHMVPTDDIIKVETESRRSVVLDPFCGTGVVLQEALLMGYDAFGTDNDLRMVQYAEENIEWLQSRFPVGGECHVTIGDATTFDWKQAFDIVACETYLGRPFSHSPNKATLDKVIRDVNTIHKKFLQNLASQSEKGTTMCLAVPAWKTQDGFRHLPVIDHLTDMGYTRTSFAHASDEDLIYHREGQIVGRELLVLTRS